MSLKVVKSKIDMLRGRSVAGGRNRARGTGLGLLPVMLQVYVCGSVSCD